MATALGILFALSPWLALATVATWLIVAVFSRYSSLAALVAAFFAPVYYFFGGGVAWSMNVLAAAAWWRSAPCSSIATAPISTGCSRARKAR